MINLALPKKISGTMKATEQKIIIQKSARYFTLGSPSEKIKNIWFVIHGYGNLAAEFINDFEIINNGENYIIAPEALNKFYIKGFSGKVGATWMTKENREDEIKDYINFLNSVYETEIKKFERKKIKINVLGFSQGCPTSVRWLVNGKCKADNLIIWAGDLPHDLDPVKTIPVLNSVNVYFAIGYDDEIINKERVNEEIQKYKSLGIDFKLYRFNGKHEINRQALLKIYTELN